MEAIMKTIYDYFVTEFLEGSDSDFNQDTPLLELGFIESASILKISQFLEQEFDIEIEPEDLVIDNFQTLSDVVNLIKTKK